MTSPSRAATSSPTFFLPIITFKHWPTAFEETDVGDATEEKTIRRIAGGSCIGHIESVIAFNPAEGTCRDASKEIAQKVADILDPRERVDADVVAFIGRQLGWQVANIFNRLIAAE